MENWTTAKRLDELYDVLTERLTPRRKTHVLGCCQMALNLAQRWEANPHCTLAATLLHDIAKHESPERLREIIQTQPELDSAEDKQHPAIWHAVAGAILARSEFGVDCDEVLRAIRLHPTGDADLTLLDKIVFLADYIEPTRRQPGVEELRRLAFENLDEALALAVERKTKHIKAQGSTLHPRSRRAFESLCGEKSPSG